jgi:molybdate transport system substrate-binding protein
MNSVADGGVVRRVLVLVSLLLLVAGACGEDNNGSGGEVTIFAAASLTDAFNRIKVDFEAAHEGVTVTYNFAGSQALVTQLDQGARADVFASANIAQMTAAQDAGLIDGAPQIFTRNRLAIIVPADNPAGIAAPRDLANPGIKLVLAVPQVPVGAYTREALDLIAADPGSGEDFRNRVEANIVSLEDNVRQVVAKVALGEADAGVVYMTDITADVAEDVMIVSIPDEFNVIAEYPVASVTDGNMELADAFIEWILSDNGQAVLQEFGFAGLP